VQVVTEIREGSAITEINDYAREVKPIVVVMGSEKQAALDRVLAGGTTFEALVHLEWPLIVVPSDARFEMIRRVALACDLENVEGTVPIEQLKNIVHHFGAQLHVLYVGAGADQLSVVDAPETAHLRAMLAELHPVYHFLPGDDIDNTIIHFLETENIDLLFVIPKKHGLLRRVFHHSHSRKMVLKAKLPVMAVHG
jgi:nucleotide-binding universal stress UspA family protein